MNINQYFQTYINYFWNWDSDPDCIRSTDIFTHNYIYFTGIGNVSYSAYALEILKLMSPQGIPYFGSYLLALFALKKQVTITQMDAIEKILVSIVGSISDQHDGIKDAITFLKKLNTLDNEYKSGQQKVNVLITIFKNCHNVLSIKDSEHIIQQIYAQPNIINDVIPILGNIDYKLIQEIKVLAILNRWFPTSESIINAVNTTIEIPIEEETIKEDNTLDGDADFITQLIENEQTFSVGSLIKRIWSGLKLPAHQYAPGEHPMGGVADIHNKGNLDQMLLSEFAFDEETFITRIANNETLYIKREVPPEENDFQRILLIDDTIYSWGTPKAIAFAAAIAIIKHPKATHTCLSYLINQSYEQINLDTVPQVINSINQVAADVDCSVGLSSYLTDVNEKDLEIFFLTHESQLNNKAIQQVFGSYPNKIKYVITTHVDGSLNFYKYHKGSKKHLQKIILPLQELWQRKSKDKKSNPIIKPNNYPVLFPIPGARKATLVMDDKIYIITKLNDLMMIDLDLDMPHKQKGAIFIEKMKVNLVRYNGISLGINKIDEYEVCYLDLVSQQIVHTNLTTGVVSEIKISETALMLFRTVCVDQQFYLLNQQQKDAWNINIENKTLTKYSNFDFDRQAASDTIASKLISKVNNNKATVLQKINLVTITHENKIKIERQELSFLHDEAYLMINKKYSHRFVAKKEGKDKFTFIEGSTIHIDYNGIMTLRSSNTEIPTIYIPLDVSNKLGLATNNEFCGNPYYFPINSNLEKISVPDFKEKYINAFINTIVDHGI